MVGHEMIITGHKMIITGHKMIITGHKMIVTTVTSAKNLHAARANDELIFNRSTRAEGVTSFICWHWCIQIIGGVKYEEIT